MDKETRYRQTRLPDIALNPVIAGIESPVIHALLCATDHGVLMTDPRGNDMLCNPRFGELFDIDPQLVVRSAREEVRRMALTRVKDPATFNAVIERIYTDPTLEHEDEVEVITDPPRILRRYTGPVFDSRGENIGRVWTFQDVTETRRLQQEVEFYAAEVENQLYQQRAHLRATTQVLDVMTSISAAVTAHGDLDPLLGTMAQILGSTPGHESAAVLIRTSGTRLHGAVCRPGRGVEPISLDAGVDPLLHRVFLEREGFAYHAVALYCAAEGPLLSALDCTSVSIAPLCRSSHLTGVLVLGSREERPQTTAHQLAHLTAVRDQVALALETHQLHRELQVAYDDLRAAQAQMVESAKLGAVGTLAAGIAHDIRNIMTPLQMELALAGASETIGAVRAQVDRLSALTHRLLALSRPAAVHLAPVSIREIVTHIRPLIQPQADVDRVRVVARFPRDLPCIYADRSRLEHLFINLILNAFNAMSARGGTLTLSGAAEQGGVRIDVKDTGQGIAPENLPRLFEPFFTTRANGTGLGLFSVRRIVEDHHGRIGVQSRLGKGTCFSIWLPTAPADVRTER